jgi:ribosomal protein L22
MLLRALCRLGGLGVRGGISTYKCNPATRTGALADAQQRARVFSSLRWSSSSSPSSSAGNASDELGGGGGGGGAEDLRRRAPLAGRKWPVGVDGEPIRTATARRLGITTSPQKLNLVARLVRGLSVDEAQRQLAGLKKKHRVEVSRTITAAATNARAFGMDEERLIVSRAHVGKGKYLKRIRPWHGKGRWGVEHKKYAHLRVELLELSDEAWEAKVLRQYVHMRYRAESSSSKPRSIPENLVKPWQVRSQLDASLEASRARALELRAALPKKRHPFPADWSPDVGDRVPVQA